MIDKSSIQKLIDSRPYWYHSIEVSPGIVTPGMHNSQTFLSHLDEIGLPSDLSGWRVLDIGCRDGFFSFEMEKRGAKVLAIDHVPPDGSGFSIASQILDSSVEYLMENVYDLSADKHGIFDLVLFLGVLYHLRNPMLALDSIREVCKPGSLLLAESHILDNHFILEDGTVTTLKKVSPELVKIPIAQFYHRGASLGEDKTNKWGPNMTGLKRMVEEARFEVLAEKIYSTRGYVAARAIYDHELNFLRILDYGKGKSY